MYQYISVYDVEYLNVFQIYSLIVFGCDSFRPSSASLCVCVCPAFLAYIQVTVGQFDKTYQTIDVLKLRSIASDRRHKGVIANTQLLHFSFSSIRCQKRPLLVVHDLLVFLKFYLLSYLWPITPPGRQAIDDSLQRPLSCATVTSLRHPMLVSATSLLRSLRHVFLGLSLFLLPCGFQVNACLVFLKQKVNIFSIFSKLFCKF